MNSTLTRTKQTVAAIERPTLKRLTDLVLLDKVPFRNKTVCVQNCRYFVILAIGLKI